MNKNESCQLYLFIILGQKSRIYASIIKLNFYVNYLLLDSLVMSYLKIILLSEVNIAPETSVEIVFLAING